MKENNGHTMNHARLVAKINGLRKEKRDFDAVQTWRIHGEACHMSFGELARIDPRREMDAEEKLVKNRMGGFNGFRRREERGKSR